MTLENSNTFAIFSRPNSKCHVHSLQQNSCYLPRTINNNIPAESTTRPDGKNRHRFTSSTWPAKFSRTLPSFIRQTINDPSVEEETASFPMDEMSVE